MHTITHHDCMTNLRYHKYKCLFGIQQQTETDLIIGAGSQERPIWTHSDLPYPLSVTYVCLHTIPGERGNTYSLNTFIGQFHKNHVDYVVCTPVNLSTLSCSHSSAENNKMVCGSKLDSLYGHNSSCLATNTKR